jgi:S-(hydroxymethyl)glutathione synthase
MAEESFLATGGCACQTNPVRYQYTKRPYEVHYCLCTDCTDVSGGAMAIYSVVERNAFKVLSGEEKLGNIDTLPTCHRKFCTQCGAHMMVYVDAFPDHLLIHIPTLDRGVDPGAKPDRWVFVNSKHPFVTVPDDGLPKYPGWEPTHRYDSPAA